MMARSFATLLTAALVFSQAALADSAQGIQLRRLGDESVIAFATKFFYKRHPNALNWSFKARYRAAENWTKLVREQTYAAEIDIGDGKPALLLVVESPNWCDTEGCLGTIFKKTATGYMLICEAALPPPEADTTHAEILPKVENGYHQIATTNKIIEWNPQPDETGLLCTEESRTR